MGGHCGGREQDRNWVYSSAKNPTPPKLVNVYSSVPLRNPIPTANTVASDELKSFDGLPCLFHSSAPIPGAFLTAGDGRTPEQTHGSGAVTIFRAVSSGLVIGKAAPSTPMSVGSSIICTFPSPYLSPQTTSGLKELYLQINLECDLVNIIPISR